MDTTHGGERTYSYELGGCSTDVSIRFTRQPIRWYSVCSNTDLLCMHELCNNPGGRKTASAGRGCNAVQG